MEVVVELGLHGVEVCKVDSMGDREVSLGTAVLLITASDVRLPNLTNCGLPVR